MIPSVNTATGLRPIISVNPNPGSWTLLKKEEFDNAYVLLVHYHGCTNYEGKKLMVFRGKYKHRELLDPHFAESDDAPIARFRPDKEGWKFAIALATFFV